MWKVFIHYHKSFLRYNACDTFKNGVPKKHTPVLVTQSRNSISFNIISTKSWQIVWPSRNSSVKYHEIWIGSFELCCDMFTLYRQTHGQIDGHRRFVCHYTSSQNFDGRIKNRDQCSNLLMWKHFTFCLTVHFGYFRNRHSVFCKD